MYRLLIAVIAAAGCAASSMVAAATTSENRTGVTELTQVPSDFVRAKPGASDPAVLALRGPSMDDFSASPAYAPFYQQTLTWSQSLCTWDPKQFSTWAECALVKAPLDWYNPARGEIEIAISRPVGGAQRPRADRLLLSNRGGPGADGLVFGARVGSLLRATYHEQVGMDPRGHGRSTPLQCPEVPHPADLPSTNDVAQWTVAQTTAHIAHTTARLAACDQAPNSLLPYISTDQTARDYNLVRAVLGYPAADFLGVSYGSWVGSVLGKMFPRQFDRIVVDSNVDFSAGSLRPMWQKYQPQAYQAALERMILPWLGRHHAQYQLGATAQEVNTTLTRMRDVLRRIPAGRKYNRATLDEILMEVAAAPRKLPALGENLVKLRTAIDAGLPDDAVVPASPMKDSPNSNVFDAIRCNDSGTWGTLSSEVERVRTVERGFPLQGQVMVNITCANWPRPPAITTELTRRPLHNVLMAQVEGDPATAYRAAHAARFSSRGTVRMVVLDDGYTHGAYSDPCMLIAEQAYIAGGQFPAKDLGCHATALPLDGTNVYEFGNPALPSDPLPVPYLHKTGDIVDPPLDVAHSGKGLRRRGTATGSVAESVAAQLATEQVDLTGWLGVP